MKKFLCLLILISIVACKSKQPSVVKNNSEKPTDTIEAKARYVKLSSNEVNIASKNRAYALGKRLLETCNTSKFKPFTKDEATDKVIQNATVERISKTCQKILIRNGKFIDLELIDITQDTETDDLLFKFKIEYEKKYFERELNVTINSDGKVSAMATKEIPKKPM